MKTLNRLILSIIVLTLFSQCNIFSQETFEIQTGNEMDIAGNNFKTSIDNDLSIDRQFNSSVEVVEYIKSNTVITIPSAIFHEIHAKDGNDIVLTGDITIVNDVSLNNGNLNLNNNNIFLESKAFLDETNGSIYGDIGFIEITQELNNIRNINPGNIGFEITTCSDIGSTTIRRGHSTQHGNSMTGIKRYFDIKSKKKSRIDATIVFYYKESELEGIEEDNLSLFISTDGGKKWKGMGGVVDTNNNTIRLTGIDTFGKSRWTAAGKGTM